MHSAERAMIAQHVIGWQPGQRVYVRGEGPSPAFHGTIDKVVVPRRGERFALVLDDAGRAHYANFSKISAAA
jgi:hypothetical protein